jgi:ABC-type lipoprotein release transport system permease subunit
MGKALARALDCNIGDIAQITTSDMRKKVPIEVIGIFDSSVQIYTADLLLVDLQTAKKILCFYSENESSDIPVYLTNPLTADRIAQQISSEIDGARPLTKSVMLNLAKQSFGQKSGFFYLIWIVFLANLILIAWSLMSQISFSLQKEIGILKAIGWDTGDIMTLKTMETFLISTFSVMCGIIVGIGYMLINAPGLKKLIIGWTDIYPDFPIPLYIEKTTVLLIVVLGILPLLIGTIIPTWKIGIIDPDEAIRK